MEQTSFGERFGRIPWSHVITPIRLRAVRDGLSLLGLAALVWAIATQPGDDVHTYWGFDATQPYGALVGHPNAFLYSPVAALAALPLHALPFPLVRGLLILIDLACLVYLARTWAVAVIALPPVLGDISSGNIHIILGTVIALSLRYPAAWSFVLLTKVTPGIGLIWFAVRRQWRELAIVIGTTLTLAFASFAIVPHWWPAWFHVLTASSGAPVTAVVLTTAPLAPRVVAAAVLVAWGARGGRAWTLPLAGLIALPEVWVMGSSMLLGALPLLRQIPAKQSPAKLPSRPLAEPVRQ